MGPDVGDSGTLAPKSTGIHENPSLLDSVHHIGLNLQEVQLHEKSVKILEQMVAANMARHPKVHTRKELNAFTALSRSLRNKSNSSNGLQQS